MCVCAVKVRCIRRESESEKEEENKENTAPHKAHVFGVRCEKNCNCNKQQQHSKAAATAVVVVEDEKKFRVEKLRTF